MFRFAWLKICVLKRHRHAADNNWKCKQFWINFTLITIYIKFCTVSQKHGNYTAEGKFHGSARNSVAHGKLWTLLISQFQFHCHVEQQSVVITLTSEVMKYLTGREYWILAPAPTVPVSSRFWWSRSNWPKFWLDLSTDAVGLQFATCGDSEHVSGRLQLLVTLHYRAVFFSYFQCSVAFLEPVL